MMLVWTGKKIDQFESELYGVICIVGCGLILFPDIATLALGIELKSKNIAKFLKIVIRLLGVIIFFYGWYIQYIFCKSNRNFNMAICAIIEFGMLFLKLKEKD